MARRWMNVITCDRSRCPARVVAPYRVVTFAELRRQAHADGWTRRDRNDYCPEHRPWPGLAAWAQRPAGQVQ